MHFWVRISSIGSKKELHLNIQVDIKHELCFIDRVYLGLAVCSQGVLYCQTGTASVPSALHASHVRSTFLDLVKALTAPVACHMTAGSMFKNCEGFT